jgi:hypothetical protein
MLQRCLVVASSDFWGVQRGYTVRLTHKLGVYLSVCRKISTLGASIAS